MQTLYSPKRSHLSRHRLNAPRPRFDRRAPVRELPNINDRINYPQLRVVDSDGAQLGVISREEALDVARDRELDLVLVSEKADLPVCRIMDYGKFKFEQEKKAKEAKKKSHQTEVKEVKMRYKIDQHDYDVRIGQAQRFLKAGDKVKCTVIFRGREIQHTPWPRPCCAAWPRIWRKRLRSSRLPNGKAAT